MLSSATCVIISSLLIGQAGGDRMMPASLQKQIDQRCIGTWAIRTTFGDERFGGGETWKWSGNKSTVVIEGYSLVKGKKSHYTCLAAWDPENKSLVIRGFAADGDSWVNRWTGFSPQGWTGRIEGTFEGQKYESAAKVDFQPDEIRYEDSTAGKPWISIAKRAGVTDENDGEKSFQAYAALAVGGTWIANVDGKQFEDTYEPILGGRFLRLTSKGVPGFPASVTIVGVDPATKICTFWGFNAKGGVSTGASTLVADGVWVGESNAVGPDSRSSWRSRLTKIDDNTVKFEVSGQTIDGDLAPFPSETIWKRHSKPAER